MPTKAPTPCPRCHTLGTCQHRGHTSSTARGYGTPHQHARSAIQATLPAPCWYCRDIIHPTDPWVAAHLVDGDDTSPRVPAHRACNEQAKGLGSR